MNALQKIQAVVLGHAVADALGVPVEFQSREELREKPVMGMRAGGTYGMPAGTWSDDTSLAIAALDSLAAGVDYVDMMQKFCAWYLDEKYTATGELFDCGIATRMALNRYQQGKPALKCGGTEENDNGNGSLMRIYPAVLYWFYRDRGSKEDLWNLVSDCSSLTHAHERSQVGCGIYAVLLAALLECPKKEVILPALQETEAFLGEWEQTKYYQRLFQRDFAQLPEDAIQSSGYVVSTLEAAVWCLLNTDNYQDCVLKAVNLGKDTDTVAAVAGSLAGALYGQEAIPEKWLNTLQNKELLLGICRKFAGEETE